MVKGIITVLNRLSMTTRTDLEEILKKFELDVSDGDGGYDTVVFKQSAIEALVEAYNRGVSDAAESAETMVELANPYDGDSAYSVVDKDSILKLKIGG
jgi:hypothetical protein